MSIRAEASGCVAAFGVSAALLAGWRATDQIEELFRPEHRIVRRSGIGNQHVRGRGFPAAWDVIENIVGGVRPHIRPITKWSGAAIRVGRLPIPGINVGR